MSIGAPVARRLRSLWIDCSVYQAGWLEALRDPVLPELRRLRLRLPRAHSEIRQFLAGAPLLDRLELLDLSGSYLTDVEADALAEGGRLSKLTLDVSFNALSGEGVRRLEPVAGRLISNGQRPGSLAEGEEPY